ncbi:MAG: bifunctional (p)ppGpp synthetase/guanosine-3',5'-bis(diphosphate) 3'-pyrophosphohydrolase [Synergistetes bacterium]|nr:bifunctional (p)ppGpp synthetase/guanosine-3',5'-bis(diphosphate) 3'-pyrophosphohydrolase [Synergistota bacterium]MCX8127143.1 bifunctional (p)ppGpp synthetase/guanosine-3',5'-bis(diphosphate) 3'-pyrophosphohydrolase [Synergistota bacterium]MDW8191971.1 bifunctional (p)ppGpp synthetase/guanosine-3',5'-bis(diphosphate) 3'-pyrophosphohydrolase [Synergistota bacterium]
MHSSLNSESLTGEKRLEDTTSIALSSSEIDKVDREFEELKELLRKREENLDLSIIDKAFYFARRFHNDQKRLSGEPYIVHPIAVSKILAELGLDEETIAAALLHDLLEDTSCSREELEKEFGGTIVRLVEGVTKLSQIPFKDEHSYQIENLRKMFLVMAHDIRVVLIKLADRLHNMRTVDYLPQDKRERIAKETLQIYAPLAHRLGIHKIKWELEDLSFKVLNPEMYETISKHVMRTRKEREIYIEDVKKILLSELEKLGINAIIQGRPKHFYSIYQKMKRKNLSLDEVMDLHAVRVIVNTVTECYTVLGVVHSLWRPIPGHFDDYIAMPKSNMYQSLHTAVVGPGGEPLEVQIRTWDMHRVAEYGIAAHWRYKEGKRRIDSIEEKISWFRKLLEWQRDVISLDEFSEGIETELSDVEEVYVFTPKGDILSLPKGSTPVDFAYAIHTDVGNSCVGAIVNNRIVPLDYKLQHGDIVKILTSSHGAPSRDWLNFVKTSRAKTKIKQWFRRKELKEREALIRRGREILARDIRGRGADDQKILASGKLNELAKEFGFLSEEDLLLGIAEGTLSVSSVLQKLLGFRIEEKREPERRKSYSPLGIMVEGIDGIQVNLAKCCSPVPGDEILGYVTKGRGITVHRVDCKSLKTFDTKRFVRVWWGGFMEGDFPVKVRIEAFDRPGLVADISREIASFGINIDSMNVKVKQSGMAEISMTIRVKNLNFLYNLFGKIREVSSVIAIQREG